jgi:hypothetical protein
MANRTLRRTGKRVENVDGSNDVRKGDVSHVDSADGASAPGTDGNIDNNGEQSYSTEHSTSDSAGASVRNNVTNIVELDPTELQQFIADGDRDRDSDGTDSGEPRKQRKTRGPNKRTKQASQTIDVTAIQMVHTMLSVVLHTPELALDESEAKQLSDAYAEFSKYHEVPLVTPKRLSEINFAGALLTVYGTRAVAVFRKGKRKPAQVVNMGQYTGESKDVG